MLILYFVLIAFLVFADQFSKRYAVHKVKEVNTLPVRVGVFKFVIVRNSGAAFGLMAKRRLLLIIITTIMVLMLLACIVYLVLLCEPAVQIFPLALIAGGALGNYIDRIRLGYVVDFISLNIDLKKMPFFNFADFFILFGCVLFVFVI